MSLEKDLWNVNMNYLQIHHLELLVVCVFVICEATYNKQMLTIPLMIDLNGLKLFSVDDLIKILRQNFKGHC